MLTFEVGHLSLKVNCFIRTYKDGKEVESLDGKVRINDTHMTPMGGGYALPMSPVWKTEAFDSHEEAIEYCKAHALKVMEWSLTHYSRKYFSFFEIVPFDFVDTY